MASDWPEASEAAMAAQDALDDAAWFGGELMKRDAENARLTALLAERDAEIKALVEALRQGIELGEAWERVDNPEAAGEWSMYLLPDFMEAARAALAGSREQAAATTTTRTITMRCHCGRGVTIGPDPWCEGCVQSAATCDCVPVVIGEGA